MLERGSVRRMTTIPPTLQAVIESSTFVHRSLDALSKKEGESLEALYETRLSQDWSRAALEERIRAWETPESLSLGLRLLRRDLILAIVGENSTGRISYETVVERMSDFAELAVSQTVRVHAKKLAERYGVPCGVSGDPQDLLVVGMGKLGGRELNVSSDIDLIFIFDENGETKATAEYPNVSKTFTVQEFYERLARRIIPALNDIEGAGFVFRVDMRLRPNGDSGPIVCSSSMLEEYLYSQGREWERFAWLKGRVVNTPVFASEEVFARQCKQLRTLVRPFVFRKYLDFGALEALRELHEKIRAETARRELLRGSIGVNVKLGRGGIREIEFITQTMQIIRGGRDPQLQGRSTLAMLSALGEENFLDPAIAHQCQLDYIFLRNVEHAIQYIDDEQTQMLPSTGEKPVAIATLLGVQPGALWKEVHAVRERVARVFDSIFQVEESTVSTEGWPIGWEMGSTSSSALLLERLQALGYGEESEELLSRILRLASGRWGKGVSDTSRVRMQKLLPIIVESCPQWQSKNGVRVVSLGEMLSRYLKLIEVIAGRSTYVALLSEYPSAAERVGKVLSASRWSADFLMRHPIILDELVDGREKEFDDYSPVDWTAWLEKLHRALELADGDQERQMNILRDAHHSAIFQLLIADLDGRFSVERLADQLSALADAVLQEVCELAWSSLATRHVDRPKFAVIGYGKLGGKELGYDSDLDLVFIFDDEGQDAERVYTRLVRRMMSWLTLQTSSGKLFNVDLRLRPNGESGLVVTPFEMFCRYQDNADGTGAWFWEHQALTRARFVAGDPELGRRFEEQRVQVLLKERGPEQTRRDVLEMREKMHEGHINRSSAFDIKHDHGGMVDVEFVVQWFILTYSARYPELTNNFGNILLLEKIGQLGLLDAELCQEAIKAYRHYRLLQHEIRLNAGENAPVRVNPTLVEKESEVVSRLWDTVFSSVREAR